MNHFNISVAEKNAAKKVMKTNVNWEINRIQNVSPV